MDRFWEEDVRSARNRSKFLLAFLVFIAISIVFYPMLNKAMEVGVKINAIMKGATTVVSN